MWRNNLEIINDKLANTKREIDLSLERAKTSPFSILLGCLKIACFVACVLCFVLGKNHSHPAHMNLMALIFFVVGSLLCVFTRACF